MKRLAVFWFFLGLFLTDTSVDCLLTPYRFVRALEYDATSGYRESHVSACTRLGMAATSNIISLGSLRWNVQTLMDAVASVNETSRTAFDSSSSYFIQDPMLSGCCASGLWCSSKDVDGTSYQCYTHNIGSNEFSNFGWIANSTRAIPVYSCTNSSYPLQQISSTVIPFIGSVRTVRNASVLQVDGLNFGKVSTDLTIRVGDSICSDVTICSNTCASCTSSQDCGDGMTCANIGPPFNFRCLRSCASNYLCPCGGECYNAKGVGNGANQLVCGAPAENKSSAPLLCRSGFSWRPNETLSGGLTDRLECLLPPSTLGSPAPLKAVRRRLSESLMILNTPVSSPDINAITSETGRKRRLQGLKYLGYPFSSGVSGGRYRYEKPCAGLGAGNQGIYPIIVERYGLWASTGLSNRVAGNVSTTPPQFNRSSLGVNSTVGTSDVSFRGLNLTGAIPSFTVTSFTCSKQSDCSVIDICTRAMCLPCSGGSCCMYTPSDVCSTVDSPLAPGTGPSSNSMIALPAAVAAAISLPPPPNPVSVYSSTSNVMNPSDRSMSTSPLSIYWDMGSLWLDPNSQSGKTAFSNSKYFRLTDPDPSTEDDVLSGVRFNSWVFPYFGTNLNKLFVSSNGYVSVVGTPPCGEIFYLGGDCTMSRNYVGVIAPLLADFFPGAYDISQIWVGGFDIGAFKSTTSLSKVACFAFIAMGLYYDKIPNPAIVDPSYTSTLCLYGDGSIRWRYGRVLGQRPNPVPKSWDATTVISTGNAGPPSQTWYNGSDPTWLAGVRSLSAGIDPETWNNQYLSDSNPPDFSAQHNPQSELLLSRGGVRPSGTVATCAANPIACMRPSCGRTNTVVMITWTGVSCGSGFEQFSPVWASPGSALPGQGPRIQCMFGSVAVTAEWVPVNTNVNTSKVLKCVVPSIPEVDSLIARTGKPASVPLSIRLVLPVSPSAYSKGAPQVVPSGGPNGIGPDAYVLDGSSSDVVLLTRVYGTTIVDKSNSSIGGSKSGVLVSHPLIFTFTNDLNALCGCAPGVSSSLTVCDACGVCGGEGNSRDCAGVCLGSAAVDDCGICSGGSTLLVPNVDKDCKGVCFGTDMSCRRGIVIEKNSTDSAQTFLFVVFLVIVSLAICTFVGLLSFNFWKNRIEERNRVMFNLMDDPSQLGLHAGLSPEVMERQKLVSFNEELSEIKSAPGGKESCAICTEDHKPGEQVRILSPCHHIFHDACIGRWLSTSTICPVCRQELRTPEEIASEQEMRRQRAEQVYEMIRADGVSDGFRIFRPQQRQAVHQQPPLQQQQQQQLQQTTIPIVPESAFSVGLAVSSGVRAGGSRRAVFAIQREEEDTGIEMSSLRPNSSAVVREVEIRPTVPLVAAVDSRPPSREAWPPLERTN